MSKSVILTGLRANNDLHLGNYLGAMLPMVEMQQKYKGKHQINMFVPDLHSFTTPIDHTKLYEQTMRNLRLFVAAGLDLDDETTYLYRQSFVPAHSELTVILNCFAYFGELSRMVEFKEKAGKHENVSAGLFDYPVLMAADILLYGAKYIPVGDDQRQHIELTRDLAIRMNNKFCDLFIVPETPDMQRKFFGNDQALRIMDLVDPTKKMSKSDQSGKGIIFLCDNPAEATKKIMSATTDSLASIAYDPKKQPGISNLLTILAAIKGESVREVAAEYDGQTEYGKLKTDVAEAVSEFLKEFQAKLSKVDDAKIGAKLAESEKVMKKQACETLLKVQKAVGLRS